MVELDGDIEDVGNLSCEEGEALDDFAVDTTEESDDCCAVVSENSISKRRSSKVYTSEDTESAEPVTSYFSFPSFIYYEKVKNGDASDFFDISPSQIKDFLFAQVLGIRIFIFLLQLLFNSWDFSTDAFKGIAVEDDELSMLDRLVRRLFAGFKRWDAVHMLHIAQHEYVFENSLAFFPFYPMTIRVLSMAWATPFVHFGLLHVSSALLVSAVAVNLGCFLIAAAMLYLIVMRISNSVKQAIIAVLLFAANPASVFFSAAYSESISSHKRPPRGSQTNKARIQQSETKNDYEFSEDGPNKKGMNNKDDDQDDRDDTDEKQILYCMLTFAGICFLIDERPSFFARYLGSLLCFSLAYATRSNGLINIGYVGFFCLIDFIFYVDKEDPRRLVVTVKRPVINILAKATSFTIRLVLAVFSISLPVIVHGRRQQIAFCSQASAASVPPTLQRFAAEHDLVTVGHTDVIDWCNVSVSIYPPFYTSVQSKYWHVSLFGYWQLRKIPCFLLAAPAFFLVAFGAWQTWNHVKKKRSLLHLFAEGGDHVPYTLHAIFMAFGALFVYNVEVFTRLLFSSSPFPYLVLARWISDVTPQVRLSDLFVPQPLPFLTYFCRRGLPEFLLYLYLMVYLIFGTTMHAMWLPFT